MEEKSFVIPSPASPVKLPPGKIPFVVVLSFIVGLYVLMMKYCLIPWLYAPYSQFWVLWIALHIFGATATGMYVIFCYWTVWTTQASVVPDNWTPDSSAIDPLSSDGKIRYCEKCDAWQPPRTDHCKYCKRCVLMRDQHCPWMNGCIGYGNIKPYILFLFNMMNYLSITVFVTTSWLFLSFWGSEFETCNWETSYDCWIITFITVFPGVMFWVVVFFLAWQIQLVSVNATSQEFMEFNAMRSRNKERVRRGALEEIESWPFDHAEESMKNFNQFMGPKYWLSPGCNEQINDGTKFFLNPKWLQMRNTSVLSDPTEII